MHLDIRREMIDGTWYNLSHPGVYHSMIHSNLTNVFHGVRKAFGCFAFGIGTGIFYDGSKNHLCPDFMLVCDMSAMVEKGIVGTPNFVAEVLCPTSARRDRIIKKAIYEQLGVPEFWLISVGDKSIEVYLLKKSAYVLDNVYALPHDWQIEDMTEEELTEIEYTFKMSIFDEMEIDIREVFLDIP